MQGSAKESNGCVKNGSKMRNPRGTSVKNEELSPSHGKALYRDTVKEGGREGGRVIEKERAEDKTDR